MVFDFQFTYMQDVRQLRDLIDFVHGQDLGYKDYHDWVQRAEAELLSGYKEAFLAYSGSRVVGNLIFQPHKGLSTLREIKNLRVHPEVRDRSFARFMLRQLEVESKGQYHGLIIDFRQDSPELGRFLLECKFVHLTTVHLYDDKSDVVMVKFLDERAGLLAPSLARKVETLARSSN